jgi:hypothetical protein
MTLEEIIADLDQVDVDTWYKPYNKDEPIPLGKTVQFAVFKLKQMREGLRQINDITQTYAKERE